MQLQKCSISTLLEEQGFQVAKGLVRSTNLPKEIGDMTLVGFVPYNVNYLRLFSTELAVNMNSPLFLAPNLIQFSKEMPVYPFFKKIKKVGGEKYKVDKNILIYPIIDEIPKDTLRNSTTKGPYLGDRLIDIIEKRKLRDLLNLLSVNEEDGMYYYSGKCGDYEFSSGIGQMIAISEDFLCLCAYMNKVTGTPCYTVLSSVETIRVLPENDF